MQYQVDPSTLSPENLVFGTLDHSKLHFCDFWTILHDLVTLPNVGKHLVLSRYAISSWSNRSNSRKRPKPSVLALWIIQKCIFVIFEWSSISDIMVKLLTPFSFIKICNIKLTGWTKLEKMANSTPGGGDLKPTRHTENFLKNQPDLSRACGFRGEFTERLNF